MLNFYDSGKTSQCLLCFVIDEFCSNGSRVVQLQVAPRGLRTAKVVKVESKASTAPAAISRR